jgi:predicted AAA+ superfamily ATPase
MGARQVGKTWLMQEFGRTEFDDVCYINCENADKIAGIFEGSINPQRIIEFLGAYHGKKIQPQTTLIIFDEIQEVPRALTSLKYFAEEAPEYAICCAGSLLGVTLHEGTSFPVGKVDFMTLNPLSFREFLTACGEEMLVEWCEKHFSEEIPDLMAEKLTDYLKKYMVIGGMPSVVNAWLETGDYGLVTEEQRRLLLSYENDFSKHAPQSIVPKIHHVWNSIPSQLSKENKKFIYGLAKEGARAREYEDALMWLKDSGVIRRIGCVNSGKLPLKAYEDLKSFKIYHLDVGLLRTLCEIDAAIIIEPEAVFREFSGTLTEQFVLQELTSLEIAPSIYYWTEGAMAEVDFIFAYKNMVIPVEAKAGLNVHAQSLKSFRQKYNPKVSIRTSLKGFKIDDGLYNVPLYMLWNLEKMI